MNQENQDEISDEMPETGSQHQMPTTTPYEQMPFEPILIGFTNGPGALSDMMEPSHQNQIPRGAIDSYVRDLIEASAINSGNGARVLFMTPSVFNNLIHHGNTAEPQTAQTAQPHQSTATTPAQLQPEQRPLSTANPSLNPCQPPSVPGQRNLSTASNSVERDSEQTSSVPSFRYQRWSFENFLNKMKDIARCVACFEVPNTIVYQCSLGHIICCPCLDIILDDVASVCPKCGTTLLRGTIFRNKFVEDMCSEIPAVCRYKPIGCRWAGCFGNIERHEEFCSYAMPPEHNS